MTGLSLFRTSASNVWSVTTLVVPTTITSLYLRVNIRCCISGLFLAGQPAFGVQGGRAARPGGGDGLPVGVVHHVAAGEHAVDGRARRGLVDQEIPLRIGGQLAGEQLGPRVVPDGH